jgi:hypothetical protein
MVSHHQAVLEAASHYGALLFSGFDIRSGEEWASVLYKTGIKEADYSAAVAVRKLIVGSFDQMKNIPI